MITREQVSETILAHLNGTLSEAALIVWAEDAFVALSEAEDNGPDEALLMEIVGYIGAGDAPGFPLSWAVLSEYLARLGVRVRVVSEAA